MAEEKKTRKKSTKPKSVYVSKDARGALEGQDENGNVVWKQTLTPLQASKLAQGGEIIPTNSRKVRYVYAYNNKGEKILVPAGLDLDKVEGRNLGLQSVKYTYSQVMSDQICMLISEGYTIREISAMDGMPPPMTMVKWQVENPEFKEAISYAKKSRAEYYSDKIHEIAHTVAEENSKSAKVSMDGMKWLASTGDPEVFGSKTQITGDKNSPITFLVDTGIRREALQVEEKEED
jgi:hypothetical protein